MLLMSESTPNTGRFTLKKSVMIGALIVGLSPLWISMVLMEMLAFPCRLFWYLRGDVEAVWNRCAKLWSAGEIVFGSMVGPSLRKPFEHTLAEHFHRFHPRARPFLLEQLHDSNPRLAAYAFKCLIRCDPISLADIPTEVLARTDTIQSIRFGCICETIRLSEYIKGYFETGQYRELDTA